MACTCCLLLIGLLGALGLVGLLYVHVQHQRPHWTVQALHRGFDLAQTVVAVRGASPLAPSWLGALPTMPALPNLPSWPVFSGSLGALALRDSR